MKKMLLILTGVTSLFTLTGCITAGGDDVDSDGNNPDTQEPGDGSGDNGSGDNDNNGGSDVEGFATSSEASKFVVEAVVEGTFFETGTFNFSENAYTKLNTSSGLSFIHSDVETEFSKLATSSASYGDLSKTTVTTELTDAEKTSIKTEGGMNASGTLSEFTKIELEFTKGTETNEIVVLLEFGVITDNLEYRVAGISVVPQVSADNTQRITDAQTFIYQKIEGALGTIPGEVLEDTSFVDIQHKYVFDAVKIGLANSSNTIATGDFKLTNLSDASLGADFIYEISFEAAQGIFYTSSWVTDTDPSSMEKTNIKIHVGENATGDMVVKDLEINADDIVDYYLSQKGELASIFEHGYQGLPDAFKELHTALVSHEAAADAGAAKTILDAYCNMYLVGGSAETTLCGDLVDFKNLIEPSADYSSLATINYDYTVNEMVTVTFKSTADNNDEFTIVFDKDATGEYVIRDYARVGVGIETALAAYKHDLQTKKTAGTLTFTDIITAIIMPVR